MRKFSTVIYHTALIICAVIIATSVNTKTFQNSLTNLTEKSVNSPGTIINLLNSNSQTSYNELTSKAKSNTPFLKISNPESKKVTTKNSSITFKGTTNISSGVKLNDKKIKLTKSKNYSFTVTEKLKYGNNKFVFKAGKITKTFTVCRKYVVAKDYSPKTKKTYAAGKKFKVKVTARRKANVTAAFNGENITLTPNSEEEGNFITFVGSFKLPNGDIKDRNLGKIEFEATYKDSTDKFTSKDIICKKSENILSSDKNATPKGGDYIDVGSGVITEIVSMRAETFKGTGKKDKSAPYYNYLPKGTVDYGSLKYETIKRDGEKLKLITLRCGKKIYKQRYDKPPKNKVTVAKQYAGSLPDHNEISVSSVKDNGTHTVLKFDTMWKAPFNFKLSKQKYNSDYTVTDITYKYVDITFYYATVFNGKVTIPSENPLFSKAKIIKNESDYTLRLYLKKQGGFYGWDAYYNSKGQLCFRFLNPAKITLCDNKYGADLTGVRILIDVGHGGIDPGTVKPGDLKNSEAARNLILAKKLASELKSIGATVYMTRTDNSTSSTDKKTKMLRSLKPDYCIAIHHDYNSSPSLSGFGAYYYYPFSKNAAKYVLNNTFKTGIYKNKTFKWHYYFMSRVSTCPVVLTENGYFSNSYDYKNIKKSAVNTKKAKALTKGIVEYFVSIQ